MNFLDALMLSKVSPKDLNKGLMGTIATAYSYSKTNYEDLMDLAAEIMAFAVIWAEKKDGFDKDRLLEDFKSKTLKAYEPMKNDYEEFEKRKENLK